MPALKTHPTRRLSHELLSVVAATIVCAIALQLAWPRPQVVFIGDSLTKRWPLPESFPSARYVNRGVSGQTAWRILMRWPRDVLWPKPHTVVLLVGTNDVYYHSSLAMTEHEIVLMERTAHWRGIRVILCTLPPTRRPDLNAGIDTLNMWLVKYAWQSGDAIADYHSALVGPDRLLRQDFAIDLIHLTPAGYAAITPVINRELR
jgi:lysophospholipase L1-like esterase